MRTTASRPLTARQALLLCPLLWAGITYAQDGVVDFTSDRWELQNAEIVSHLDRECLAGTAYLKDVEFENGVIEVDVAVDGTRSYPGIIFRRQSEENHERFYIRPHRAGLYPDALQYTPVFNSVACWQLYSGDGFTAGASIPSNGWIHLRLEVHGTQARVYLNGAEQPALVINELKHGVSKGTVGVMGPRNGTAHFSNFSYRADDDLVFDEPPEVKTRAGTLTEWELSRALPAGQLDSEQYPSFFLMFSAGWQKVQSEASGLVNVCRHLERSGRAPDCVLARTVIATDKKKDVKLSFGYSDDVSIFLNGKKVFAGRSGYRSRDPSFVGVIGLNDDVHLTLQKGLNEILLIVTESFGGWGFTCRVNRRLDSPARQEGLLTKVWETPAEFNIPESVLYDPEREMLYVSSFAQAGGGGRNAGYISRLGLDGEIKDLRWVDGLDGPCGMGIYGNKLYVAEGPRGLVEIDIETGSVLNRYSAPGATFLNDLVIDGAGNVYVSNSSRVAADKDIYRFSGGQFEVWMEGDDIQRANGLFIHGNDLVVGSTGNGLLQAVSLDERRVRTITCLGARVIDGIRVDNENNYLVSHWEGQTYLISPAGEITQILDTQEARLNIADFEFIKERNLLIVPTFLGNRVTAYRLSGQ